MRADRCLFTLALLAAAGCASVPDDPAEGFGITQYSARLRQDITAPVSLHHPAQPLPSKPAVILMTGCDGSVSSGARALIEQLNAAGVLVARLRSLEPAARGSACRRGHRQMSGIERSEEAFRTRDALVARGLAHEGNVGLLGFSHGGWAITHAMFRDTGSGYGARDKPPFAAAVAFYPYCSALNVGSMRPLKTPTLLMSGSADNWTTAYDCRQLVERAERENAPGAIALAFVEFPRAAHSWDNQKPARTVQTDKGEAMVAYDAQATERSLAMAMAFFRRHLALR